MDFNNKMLDWQDNPDIREINQPEYAALEMLCMEPLVVDLPETGEVLIYGDPFALAEKLDSFQGDNIYNFGGDCGLVTVNNMLIMGGLESTEDEVVGRAISMGLCNYSPFNDSSENGGTTVYERQALLNSYGIPSMVFESYAASPDAIASFVEAGHGVNISVNAGYAWDDPNYITHGGSNHSITVTGTVRDVQTHELKGLIVCDSGPGRADSGRMFMSLDRLNDAYINVPGTTALVTSEPIR